jgi:hypothetical protein
VGWYTLTPYFHFLFLRPVAIQVLTASQSSRNVHGNRLRVPALLESLLSAALSGNICLSWPADSVNCFLVGDYPAEDLWPGSSERRGDQTSLGSKSLRQSGTGMLRVAPRKRVVGNPEDGIPGFLWNELSLVAWLTCLSSCGLLTQREVAKDDSLGWEPDSLNHPWLLLGPVIWWLFPILLMAAGSLEILVN